MSKGGLINWLRRAWIRWTSVSPDSVVKDVNGMPPNSRSLPPLRYRRWMP